MTAYDLVLLFGYRTAGIGVVMFNLIRAARATTVACLSAVTILGVSATATAQPGDNKANNDKLFAMLSGGYTPPYCVAGKLYDAAIARLGCGPLPGGPSGSVWSLYSNVADANNDFGKLANSGSPLPCPGTTDTAPVAWPGGMVSCRTARGPNDGAPTLAWSRSADSLVVSASGHDLAALYSWWLGAR
ncbi:MAG: hypothetical protein QOD10_873 [Mycobacterium sp.]|nr:hypothetical protein [Mycobacterium sp.]